MVSPLSHRAGEATQSGIAFKFLDLFEAFEKLVPLSILRFERNFHALQGISTPDQHHLRYRPALRLRLRFTEHRWGDHPAMSAGPSGGSGPRGRPGKREVGRRRRIDDRGAAAPSSKGCSAELPGFPGARCRHRHCRFGLDGSSSIEATSSEVVYFVFHQN